MGAYGSPELNENEPREYQWNTTQFPQRQSFINVCQYCGYQYQGNYCPNCATKAGSRKPIFINHGRSVMWFFVGFLAGLISFIVLVMTFARPTV